jgi:hypothetical protein
MVRRQSSFPHEFGDITIAERKVQGPADATKDDFSFVMSPVKRVIRGDRDGVSFYRSDGKTSITASTPASSDTDH